MINFKLPDGVVQLTTVEDVEQAWGDLLTYETGDEAEPKAVRFADNPRVAIAADAVYVKLRRPLKAGPQMELTDVLEIKEPNVGHLRLTDKYKGEMEKAICLLTSICAIPNAEINYMAGSDMALCGEVVNAFL